MTQIAHWQKPIFIALASGLVLAPLAFGGTTGWFTGVFAVTVGVLAVTWSAAALFQPRIQPDNPVIGLGPIILAACLYGLAVGWCFFQASVPVPDSITHEAWRDAAGLLDRAVTPVLSLNPQASIAGAMRLSGYGIVFFLCFRFAAREARAIQLLTIIAVSGAVYALYGIGLEISASESVLWYARTFEAGNLSSTFPNRNAFASYATLCLLSGCMVMYRRQIRIEDTTNGWRQALVVIVRYYFRRNGWFFYVAIALFVAILLTHSRAGLATTVIAFSVMAGCAALGTGIKSAAAVGSVLTAFCAIALFWMLGRATAERFEKIQAASLERLEIYRLTISAIADRPLFGTGLGTFADVFPAYRSAALRAKIEFAHNSYLENALEMGIPAALAFYGALAALLFVYLRALIAKRTAHPYPALGVAVIAAAFFHSLFDYAVQFPAVAILLAALLGIAAAQSVSGVPSGRINPHHPDRRM